MFFLILLVCLFFIFVIYKISAKKFVAIVKAQSVLEVSTYSKSKYFALYLALCLLVCLIILFIGYELLLNWYLQNYILQVENASPRALMLYKQQAKQLAGDTGFFGNNNTIKFNTLLDKNIITELAKIYNYYLFISYAIFLAVTLSILYLLYVYLIKKVNIDLNYTNMVERVVKNVLLAFTTVAVVTTMAITISLLLETITFFKQVPVHKFLFGTNWDPSQADIDTENSFGSLPLITGTILIALIAIIFATILGVLGAIYMAEYMPKRLRKIVKPALEILAGIPSIVYGFFAAVYLAPVTVSALAFFGISARQENALNAGIIIGVMIIPFISSITDDALKSVPKAIKEGALAMGSLKHELIIKILVPSALPGIMGGVILALSRAIGETMIVVMAASLSANLTFNPAEPVTTITTQIAMLLQGDQEFNSPKTLSTFALGLLLLILTLILNIFIFKITKKYSNKF